MAKVKIYGDTNKGCIFFEGSTVDPKFLGTVSCSIHPTETDRLVLVRNDRTERDSGASRKIFRRLKATRVQNESAETLITDLGYSITEVCDYINEQANLVGSTPVTVAPGSFVDMFRDVLDATIIFDNGDNHNVNAIMALSVEGSITIKSIVGDRKYYEGLDHSSLTIAGVAPGGGLEDVVNALNALFTVNPQGAITYPPGTTVLQTGVQPDAFYIGDDVIDPVGDDRFGVSGDTNSLENFYVGGDPLTQNGEFYEFPLRFNDSRFFLGLSDEAGKDDIVSGRGFWGSGSTSNAEWLLGFYEGYNAPWTFYGARPQASYTSYFSQNVFRPATHNDDLTNVVLARVGITEDRYIAVWVKLNQANGETWELVARSTYIIEEGNWYPVWAGTGNASLHDHPTKHIAEPSAPVLHWRYVESPDGNFEYPLFATEEEANYADTENGGTGTSNGMVYIDDLTGSTWYMPTVGGETAGTSAPTDPKYTEITTQTDGDLLPPAYAGPDVFFSEADAVNIQLDEAGATYTTSVYNLPSGLSLNGSGQIVGTLPYVTESTEYIVTVTRTNTAGSTSSNFTINVADNLALSEISGWTIHQGNTVAPQQVLNTQRGVLEHDLSISPGQEYVWSGENYASMGFLDAAGEAVKTTADFPTTTGFDLRFSTWITRINKGDRIGWVDQSTKIVGQVRDQSFRLVYELSGEMVLYMNDVEQARSSVIFSGPKTLVYVTEEAYNLDVLVPLLSVVDTVFAGDPPSGFTLEHDNMVDSVTLDEGGVASLDLTLGSGKRLIVSQTWIEANVLTNMTDNTDEIFIGVPDASADWTIISETSDFDAVIQWKGNSPTSHDSCVYAGSAYNTVTVGSATDAFYDYAIELDDAGNLCVLRGTMTQLTSEASPSEGGTFNSYYTYDSYSEQTAPLPLVVACKGTVLTLNASGLSVIDIPAPPSGLLTPWNYGVQFSGNSQYAKMSTVGDDRMPVRQGTTTVSMPTAGETSAFSLADPWATAVVFKSDGNASLQTIWAQGDGTDDIRLQVDSSGIAALSWGSSTLVVGAVATGTWYGVYIDHNGFRSASPTTAELKEALRIKLVDLEDGTVTTLTADALFAATMLNGISGDFHVGGQGTSSSLHGDVASMTVTTLRKGVALPDDTEVAMMVRDPKQWLTDYKIGNPYRQPSASTEYASFSVGNILTALSTQMWLMGDGQNDSFTNMIRNQSSPGDTSFTRLNLINMTASDLQNQTITGLS